MTTTMIRRLRLAPVFAALLLAGCATWNQPKVVAGDSLDTVRTRMGNPTNVYPLPEGGQEFEYATGPFGQRTWMVRFDANGKVLAAEQVLRGETFAKLRIGESKKDDVLRLVGRPSETSRVFLGNFEVWSYRYKENDVWNSMMHVHFDDRGVVKLVQNGPDPMYDDRRPFR